MRASRAPSTAVVDDVVTAQGQELVECLAEIVGQEGVQNRVDAAEERVAT